MIKLFKCKENSFFKNIISIDLFLSAFNDTLNVILNAEKNGHIKFCFNDEILANGFARSTSFSVNRLNIDELDKKYLENDSHIKRNSIEEYIEDCKANNVTKIFDLSSKSIILN
jgi:hypothetical protein